MEIIKINNKQLGKKIGEIAEPSYKGHTVNTFIGGVIPIKVKTDMSQQDWDKFCDGELSNRDMVRLRMCGIL